MDQSLSVTPPPELVQQWMTEYTETKPNCLATWLITARAAQWGWDQREPEIQAAADAELEACLRLVEIDGGEDAYDFARYIRAARRPKPPSLKEQALAALGEMSIEPCLINGVDANASVRAKYNTIRRALEQLND